MSSSSSGFDLYGLIMEAEEDMRLALKAAKERGLERSRLEAHYYSVKADAVQAMKDQGCTATEISLRIKGDPAVNQAMRAFHDAEVGYDNAREAINVYKKIHAFYCEQFAREWGQSGRE